MHIVLLGGIMMRLLAVKSIIVLVALLTLPKFEQWYFKCTIKGIVLQVDGQNRVLLAQNLELKEEDLLRTYTEWFLGDYDVIEVLNVGGVEPGMLLSVHFDNRQAPHSAIKVHALDYEVLDYAFLVVETVAPASAVSQEFSDLSRIFPQDEGRLQVFSDEADAGYIQKLTQIREASDYTEFYFEGQLTDLTPNEDYLSFNLMYLVEEDTIVEYIHSTDRKNLSNQSIIERKAVLKTPLEVGNSWVQSFNLNGEQYAAVTEIVTVSQNSEGKMEYETVTWVEDIEGYADNLYEERRIFVEGSGMVQFLYRPSLVQLSLETAVEDDKQEFLLGFSLVTEHQETISSQ